MMSQQLFTATQPTVLTQPPRLKKVKKEPPRLKIEPPRPKIELKKVKIEPPRPKKVKIEQDRAALARAAAEIEDAAQLKQNVQHCTDSTVDRMKLAPHQAAILQAMETGVPPVAPKKRENHQNQAKLKYSGCKQRVARRRQLIQNILVEQQWICNLRRRAPGSAVRLGKRTRRQRQPSSRTVSWQLLIDFDLIWSQQRTKEDIKAGNLTKTKPTAPRAAQTL